ncbi:hypothetical protein [Streptomyces roseoviridis]|uniref:Uncharacterized protein n=1 Tax=Streptomyces roseoviridis TaxID=67361 RepID=A0ABV5QX72_9ACTN
MTNGRVPGPGGAAGRTAGSARATAAAFGGADDLAADAISENLDLVANPAFRRSDRSRPHCAAAANGSASCRSPATAG